MTDLTVTERKAQSMEIKELGCQACQHRTEIFQDTYSCGLTEPRTFPKCRSSHFKLRVDPEMWRHNCCVEGDISIEVGKECDWCGAEE